MIARLLDWLARPVPTACLQQVAVTALQARARRLAPADGLRLLFEVDRHLYRTEGALAIAYGQGVHTKHRHMGYHEFFVDRVKRDERVLDIGCGNGALAYDLAERAGAKLVGLEIDPGKVDAARQRFGHERVTYLQGDVLQTLSAGPFDVIVLSNVLEHLPQRPELLRRLVQETKASRLLIRVPMFERDWRVPLKQELGLDWRLDPTHETEYTLESYHEEMRAANLEVRWLEVRWGEIWSELISDNAGGGGGG